MSLKSSATQSAYSVPWMMTGYKDIVADFEADFDILDFTATGVEELVAIQDGDDVIVDLGLGNSVTLLDTQLTDLNDANALF